MVRFSVAVIQEDCLPDDLYCRINLWIWRIIPRILLGLGTFGNLANIAVICRKSMRSKPLVVLALLAVFDLMCLWLSEITSYQWNVFQQDTAEAEFFNRVMSYLLVVNYFSSNWTIAIFTMERLSAVFFPFTGKLFCATKKTVIAVFVLVICQYIHAGIVMLGYKHLLPHNTMQFVNKTNPSCPFVSEDFADSCVILRMELIGTSTVLPLLVAITGNMALVFKFICCKSTTLINSRPDTQTKILFAVTGFLLATMFATAVGVGLKIQFLNEIETSHTLKLFTIVLRVIQLSNYSCNFFLYLWTGKLFRAEFKLMCKEIKNGLLTRNKS